MGDFFISYVMEKCPVGDLYGVYHSPVTPSHRHFLPHFARAEEAKAAFLCGPLAMASITMMTAELMVTSLVATASL